jgi:hypothetical protein
MEGVFLLFAALFMFMFSVFMFSISRKHKYVYDDTKLMKLATEIVKHVYVKAGIKYNVNDTYVLLREYIFSNRNSLRDVNDILNETTPTGDMKKRSLFDRRYTLIYRALYLFSQKDSYCYFREQEKRDLIEKLSYVLNA